MRVYYRLMKFYGFGGSFGGGGGASLYVVILRQEASQTKNPPKLVHISYERYKI